MSNKNIAIAGATGSLGKELTRALLSSELRPKFGQIILLSRKGSLQLEQWARQGAQIVIYDEKNLAQSLQDVDVLINAIGFEGDAFRDKLLRAIPDTNIHLYFPSEFGVDHTHHDFSHPEWDAKKRHYALAQSLLPARTKMCRLFIALFLDDSVGPWYGFDTAARKYEAVGSVDSQVSYTSIIDAARVVAVISTMEPDDVPAELRIAGTSASTREIAAMMSHASGIDEIKLGAVDGRDFKRASLAESQDPVRYLRFLMGDGSIDNRSQSQGGRGNDNEVVNRDERVFRWKTIHEHVNEIAESKGEV